MVVCGITMNLPVTIKMTRRSDGLSVEFKDSLYQTEGYDGVFIWSEGNYSCDCNRYLSFERALGKTEEWIAANDPAKCGNVDYRVDWIKDESGEILYKEDLK